MLTKQFLSKVFGLARANPKTRNVRVGPNWPKPKPDRSNPKIQIPRVGSTRVNPKIYTTHWKLLSGANPKTGSVRAGLDRA